MLLLLPLLRHNPNLSEQLFNQAAQAITIQKVWNDRYIHELQELAKYYEHFPAAKNTLQILEAVFPKRMQIQQFELEGDFSLTKSLEKAAGVRVDFACMAIPLAHDLIYEEAHSCESRITIEVDQWSCGEVKEVEVTSK